MGAFVFVNCINVGFLMCVMVEIALLLNKSSHMASHCCNTHHAQTKFINDDDDNDSSTRMT